MQFSIEPILSVVASTKGPAYSAPCHQKPLLTLVEHVLGKTRGPSIAGFLTECVTTGLVVLQQYPRLAQVQFEAKLEGEVQYYRWLAAQQQRLDLPGQLSIERPSSVNLQDALHQISVIVEATCRHLTSTEGEPT